MYPQFLIGVQIEFHAEIMVFAGGHGIGSDLSQL
jgi:hypothetical protein